MNPQKWTLTVEVANVFGVRAICPLNDFRERLIRSRGNHVEATSSDPG